MCGHYQITACPTARRPEALRVLHDGLPADQQTALVHALQSIEPQDAAVFAGLLIAESAAGLVGASWAQLTEGRTAVVWLPDENSPAAIPLLQAVATYLDDHQIALAQLLVSHEGKVDESLLQAADFQQLAKLAYLSADRRLFPETQPESSLVFQSDAAAEPDRLGQLLLGTYAGSRDCPQLNGVRSSADVINGYRQQGTFSPERWFIIQQDGRDIGTLILTVHAEQGNWELVYMGLVPEARGQGYGRQILQFAMWQAKRGGAERLVLAVDEANCFALDMYQQTGFVAWDYRTVYARLRPQHGSTI